MARFRRHVNYANVTATLALFIALGGGAYAAINLPKNSVTTVQIKNGSLLAKDFKKGQLKAGPTGAEGAKGLPGATGERGLGGPAGIPGLTGETGAKGDQGLPGVDGSAKAYAYVSSQGTVGPNAVGITTANITPHLANMHSQYCIDGLSFTPRVALVQPDVLSGGQHPVAEVNTPSDGTNDCGNAQVYVRVAELAVSGGALTATGYASGHGFYIEIN